MNNAEVKHIFNEEVINAAVNAAVVGWMEKNPTHTSEERAAATDTIRANILASRTKDKFLNSKANRAARKAHVAEEAAKHGLIFVSATDLAEVDDKFEMSHDEFQKCKTPFLFSLLEELVNGLGLKKQVERTVTFCVKTESIGYGQTGIKFSVSLQNPADSKDLLIAREYALARFLDGKTMEIAMPNIVVERLGINEVMRASLDQGIPAIYAAKFL